MDGATALGDDPVDGRESEPGAFAGLLRRKERIERARSRAFVHPLPGVGNGQRDPGSRVVISVAGRIRVARVDVRRHDRELAARRHRVPRVDRQVQDHLLELARVGLDVSQLRVEYDLESNVLSD